MVGVRQYWSVFASQYSQLWISSLRHHFLVVSSLSESVARSIEMKSPLLGLSTARSLAQAIGHE
ncbi:hypothetical protein [Actinocrispum sp. NPDC049592]|uniref:hypothetical protein n=1 Tax=Actinocrispum sp. NPDC049592 TaxID=3154835 RepID=UPI00341D66C5